MTFRFVKIETVERKLWDDLQNYFRLSAPFYGVDQAIESLQVMKIPWEKLITFISEHPNDQRIDSIWQ